MKISKASVVLIFWGTLRSLTALSVEDENGQEFDTTTNREDMDRTTNREDFDRSTNGEDFDTRERGMDEMEKPFCRGSQCRKNYSLHSQHMQVYAEMKKGQKNKDPYNRIRTGVIPTTATKEQEDFYAEHRKSSHKTQTGSKLAKRPSFFSNHAEHDRVGESDVQQLPNVIQHKRQQHIQQKNNTWERTTILSGLVKQNSNGKQQTLADLFKELVAGANANGKSNLPGPSFEAAQPLATAPSQTLATVPSQIQTTFANTYGRQGVTNLTARPPYSFIEDSERTSSFSSNLNQESNDPPSQQQQQSFLSLEQPFANHAFYDDEDYQENEAKEEQKSGHKDALSTTEPTSFLQLFGPLYDPVKMKLNLPSEISKTLTSASTPTTTAPPAADQSNSALYTSFLDTVLVNRPLFGAATDQSTPTPTAESTTPAAPTSNINNIEDWYMKYMSKILASTTNSPPTPPPTSFDPTTTSEPSSPMSFNLFEESLDFTTPTTDDSQGIRNELQEILSSLPGSGIITSMTPTASATTTAGLMTCPSTCTCSCPSSSAQLPSLLLNNQDKLVAEEGTKMPQIVLEQDSGKKVNLDISLLPCARTATYQLNLALKLCRRK